MRPLLWLYGVTLRRGGRILFKELDVALGRGDAVHVIGPNGCGKSSLIRLAAGLLDPECGEAYTVGTSLADEYLALDGELPLERALAFWNGPHLAEAITAFSLNELTHVPVRLLSTGQAKRARLARVMASGQPVWLLDEPLNGLDIQGIAQLNSAIATHRSAGGAVLAASHTALAGNWHVLDLGQ